MNSCLFERYRLFYLSHKDRIIVALHSLVLFSAGAFMLRVSWKKWAHPFIDYGRELYVPWQLSQGRLLYRDIHHIYGPLSDYTNAFLFKLFGVNLMTLAYFNIALVVVLTVLIYDFFRQTAGRTAAFLSSLIFLVLFAFGQTSLVGNFNFVCAYAYELSHGVFLSLFAAWLFLNYLRTERLALMRVIGFVSGLVFLTKSEVFAAHILSLCVGFALLFRAGGEGGRSAGRIIAEYAAFFLMPVGVFSVMYAMRTGAAETVNVLVFPYALGFHADRVHYFYQHVFGLDSLSLAAVLAAVLKVLGSLALYGLLFMVFKTAAGIPLPAASRTRAALWPVIAVLAFGVSALLFSLFEWWKVALAFTRAMPFVMLIFLVCGFIGTRARGPGTPERVRIIASSVFAAFAFFLSAKIFLETRVLDYGFALALPAVLMSVAVVCHWMPKIAGRRDTAAPGGGSLPAAKFAIACLALSISFFYARHQIRAFYDTKTEALGRGGDLIRIYPASMEMDTRKTVTNAELKEALSYIERSMKGDETFVVFPEGVMLNYLSRRKNPTPYIQTMPLEFFTHGDGPLIAALSQKKPDYVVLLSRHVWEYGYGHFGFGYAQATFRWIRGHYDLVHAVGKSAYADGARSISFYKRRPDAAPLAFPDRAGTGAIP